MIVFDFVKKLLGWVDERSRKRRADDSHNFDKEFVTPKKQRCSHKTTSLEEEYFEIEDSDNDDEIIATKKYSPRNSCNRLNGTHSKFYSPCERLPSTPISKSHFSMNNCKKLNMGYFANKENTLAKVNIDKCPTLKNTCQLKQKNQYEELLQNFLPHNHLQHNKSKEHQSVQKRVEVIEIDKIDTSTPYKPQINSNVSVIPCHSKWSLPSIIEKEKERIVPLVIEDRNENILQPNEVQILKIKHPVAKPIKHNSIEAIRSNTLRDKLSAKIVTRGDFIPQISKIYNDRIEVHSKEAEKVRKGLHLLSKRNQVAREEALGKRLAVSMRLCEAVLDETEEPEEPSLPTLTEEMLSEVKNAFVPVPPDEVLIEAYGLRITRKDINTLAQLHWLNDEVINFYMNLLISRGTGDKFPKVHAMNTFFYPKLLSGGHSSLKRWTRKIDIFGQDIVVVPVHLGIHWCMSIIDFRDKSIRYYDSMGTSNPKCLSALRQYLEEESMDKKKKPFDTSDWKLESEKNIPQQMNGSDCGVFSCMFAEYICANKKITFSQDDMPYFRNKMAYEILKNKLL